MCIVFTKRKVFALHAVHVGALPARAHSPRNSSRLISSGGGAAYGGSSVWKSWKSGQNCESRLRVSKARSTSGSV